MTKVYCTYGSDDKLCQLINEMQLVRGSSGHVFHENGNEVSPEEWRELRDAYEEINDIGEYDAYDIEFAVENMVSLGE